MDAVTVALGGAESASSYFWCATSPVERIVVRTDMPTLEWIGKKAVLNNHRKVPYHLLKAEPSLSVGEAG